MAGAKKMVGKRNADVPSLARSKDEYKNKYGYDDDEDKDHKKPEDDKYKKPDDKPKDDDKYKKPDDKPKDDDKYKKPDDKSKPKPDDKPKPKPRPYGDDEDEEEEEHQKPKAKPYGYDDEDVKPKHNGKGKYKHHNEKYIKSHRSYKVVTFLDENCTEQGYSLTVRNSECYLLPNGDSLHVTVIGERASVLYFTNTKCEGLPVDDSLDVEKDKCFNLRALHHKIVPHRD